MILTHFTDMTFHLKDVVTICIVLFTVAGSYFTINFTVKSNKRRICRLEKKVFKLK